MSQFENENPDYFLFYSKLAPGLSEHVRFVYLQTCLSNSETTSEAFSKTLVS